MSVTILSGQSVLDLAIQTTGSTESALQIAIVNEISITDSLVAGKEVSSVPVINKPIYDYYQNRQLKPATGTVSEQMIIRRGIGFMGVGVDFVVNSN